jgi:hypothetical protein
MKSECYKLKKKVKWKYINKMQGFISTNEKQIFKNIENTEVRHQEEVCFQNDTLMVFYIPFGR